MRTVTSTLGSLRRLGALGVCLALAACGQSQNWQDSKAFVTVSGTVSGFTGGTLALWNNGRDKTTVTGNGTFKFSLSIASGDDYAVAVATQPAGLTCTVTNGIGKAGADVSNVAVTCVPYSFTRRALPAIYSTGKAINYSAYRGAGPAAKEVPSDTEIQQDLTLLNAAGYNLLRLFGSETPQDDRVSESILRLANQYYPGMKFHIGVALGGLTSCNDPKNDINVGYLITKLSKYPNVVAISVGNETSFYSKFMPLACLEGYVRNIRAQVTQPVTADDDFTFYAGLTSAFGDRVAVKPDTILALIDFASIHMYPISNANSWNWQQTAVAAGPARAQASMEASLVTAKANYNAVAAYQYRGAAGTTVSVGASMPIVVGETGWKARQTNPGSEIEQFEATAVNAKWYFDLLYGNPSKNYPSWQGSAGGPLTIFYFEAFDEAWKGTDDGWGLWSAARSARYAFCGTPSGPACTTDLYQGAGFFIPPLFATITFDSPTINYSLLGFGGAEDSQIVTDPTGGTNKVGRVNRSATAEVFAGTVVATGGNLTAGIMPFNAANTRMTVRVYSPTAGIKVRLKVEDSNDSSHSVETEATTTVANAWETLTFDFANQAAGTTAFNPAFTYNRVIIFFNFGVSGATAGAKTYYFDDVTFIGGGGLPNIGPFSDISFDSAGVVYTLTGFGGAEDSSLQLDPTNAANTVVRVRRSATAETFAGTVVSTGANLTAGKIPFSATNTKMTVRVYSPAAGIHVRLKVEDAADSTHSVETEAITTLANAWETLTFDFANQVAGTAALNLAFNYNRLIIFFNFGVTGAAAGAQTYYFDDVLFVTGGGGASGSTGTCAAPSCTDFSAAGIGFAPFENPGGGSVEIANDPNDAANKVVKFIKKVGDNDFFGTTITGLAGPATLTATSKTVTLRVFSPAVGTNFLFKLEGGPGGAVTEKDMVTTVAGAWETLSFDLATGAVGTYATVVIFPHGRSTVTADTTMYVDELKFPAAAGGGGACTAPTCVDFSAAGIGFGPFENQGGGTVAIDNDPLDAANKVAKFVKKPGDGDFFGTTITGLGGSVVLTATEKTVTLRVFSPAAGTNFLLKFEGGSGPATTEKDVVTTGAGAWETLTFVMPDAGTYTTVVIFPHGRSQVTADTTMYIDDLKFPAFNVSGGGGGGFVNGIYADDYVGTLPTAKSAQGGDVGFFFDPRFAVGTTAAYDFGGVVGAAQDPNGVHNFYYGLGLNAPAITDAYFGGFVNAPGNGAVNVTTFTNIRLKFWGPAELFEQSFTPAIQVVLAGPPVGGCSSNSGRSEIQTIIPTAQKIGAGSLYTLPLNGFTLKFPCSGETTVAQVLANIAQVNISLIGTNIQYSIKDPNGTAYPNGLNIGPINFN